MRRAGALAVAALVGLAVAPSVARALDVDEARHLLARTGFAAPVGEVEAVLPLGRAEAVAHIIGAAGAAAVTPSPDRAEDWIFPFSRRMSDQQRREMRDGMRRQAMELKAWWYGEMIATPTPITEVMTLFWHNHFTSAIQSVKLAAPMYRQNVLLRRHALGNFGDLLREIGRDPAMMLYLDTVRNVKAAPNENYARELLELFTLGEGHYTETDIKEIARAFTGLGVDLGNGETVLRPRQHDRGEKTILGRTGDFDADDVAGLLLAQPRTAETIVEKMWRAFVSDTPDADEVRRLAAVFREADYEIEPLLSAVLLSDAFWAPENRGVLIKSPVDLLVGTVRQFRLPLRKPRVLVMEGRRLGQDVFDPPNVKGWPGGAAWITGDTLLVRGDIMRRVTGEDDADGRMARARGARGGPGRALDHWAAGLEGEWRNPDQVVALLLPLPPVDSEVLDGDATGALVRRLVADPVYQLK